jgi:hypothetical protein
MRLYGFPPAARYGYPIGIDRMWTAAQTAQFTDHGAGSQIRATAPRVTPRKR